MKMARRPDVIVPCKNNKQDAENPANHEPQCGLFCALGRVVVTHSVCELLSGVIVSPPHGVGATMKEMG